MSISDNITNGLIASGRLKTAVRNTPSQYRGRQKQYFGDPSAEFVHQYAKYASDFIEARVQGLNPDAPYEWETTMIRMADIAPETASTLRKQDVYKDIIFADESIEYVPEGTKIDAMGSIALQLSPSPLHFCALLCHSFAIPSTTALCLASATRCFTLQCRCFSGRIKATHFDAQPSRLTLPTAKAEGFSVQRPLHRSGVLHSLPERIGSGVSRPTVCLDYHHA